MTLGTSRTTLRATRPRVLPVGDHALLVELPTAERAQALHAELIRRRAEGTIPAVREIVPAARTVLIDGIADPGPLAARLTGWHVPPLAAAATGGTVEIPVRYDGPDLAHVASAWRVTPREAARIHAGAEYRVAFCGFTPGFGYLTRLGEPAAPAPAPVPRRATPRTSVPAGSVALAGPYSGVYPRASPGGWQLVGTTDAELWHPERERPALLAPGTRVRFVPAPGPASTP